MTSASTDKIPRIAILGAGPTGLDAALAAAEAGLPFTVYEQAAAPAGHVCSWGHVRLFSPWDLNVSPRMARALGAAGREVPVGDSCPTGAELVQRVLAPVAGLPVVAPHLRLATRVVAVGRKGLLKHEEIASDERAARPFRLLVRDAAGERFEEADVVLDCTGTWGQPNRLGDGGLPAPGETELDAEIVRHPPDLTARRDAWAGRRVLLVGGGHSAQTAALDLAALAAESPETRVTWLLRSLPDGGDPEADPLPERGRLEAEARRLAEGASPALQVRLGTVERLARTDGGGVAVSVGGPDGGGELIADRVLALTGYVGDHGMHRQLQVHQCYATEGPMKLAAALLGAGGDGGDCLQQESHGADTLVNPEPGFFLLGVKSYGRNNTFLMRVGWQQVDEVFGLLRPAG